MTAIDRLRAIDDKLIDLTQDGYLWLYDRTGIYLGTCAVTLYLSHLALKFPSDIIGWILAGIVLAMLSRLYLQQQMGLLATINSEAKRWRESIFRRCTFAVVALALITPPYKLSGAVGIVVSSFMWGYVLAIQLRAREPKDIFERAPTPAPVRAS